MSREDTAQADARRRLLNEMGIEVWHLRAKDAGAGAPVDPVSATAGADRATASREPAAADVQRTRAVFDPQSATAESRAIAAGPRPVETASRQQAETPFAVEALAVPGALLVANAFSSRGQAMLAKDVVRAARRDWAAVVRQARFDWPQPGASGASSPALGAFIEKQAEDCAATLLLITESAAAHLHDDALEFTAVPDIASLSDPHNKLALWRRLQMLRLV